MTAPRNTGGDPERPFETVIATSFTVSVLAALGLAVLYWQGGQPQLEGALLAVAAAGIAVGLITWSHRLMPNEPESEELDDPGSSSSERQVFDDDLDYGNVLSRRRLLRRFLMASLVAVGAAFLFPLRSLGPRPTDRELDDTPWKFGTRLVTEGGAPVLAADVPANGLVTVFPEGALNSENGQAVLMRVDPTLLRPLPGRESWTPQGLIAYSKVCTHAGCPVGLYEASSHQLLCPCHQSTFDVLDGAKPVFGPAALRLPQLPLAVDPTGRVYATGGFSEPPGPANWNRKS
ncbi:MAG: Rieske (2Fe-2S) domain protein [Actinomycetia bacterium]|jgi:ubiquinol-cytochrome c reductase iron-sulfur subunit|nr:Rieske (2Fe-2S) domain protein [Actinomycetes bacterium]MDQ1460266.1 ubiquinol-cytochrome c reductase iron-sulfur subunit [Actinomycetota bacterium]